MNKKERAGEGERVQKETRTGKIVKYADYTVEAKVSSVRHFPIVEAVRQGWELTTKPQNGIFNYRHSVPSTYVSCLVADLRPLGHKHFHFYLSALLN